MATGVITGKTNIPTKLAKYTGLETDTSITLVDDIAKTIAVDVKNVPTNYVTTDTIQDITGQKTFTSSPVIKDCQGGLVVEETDGTFRTKYIEYQADGVRILYDPSSSQYPTILKFPVVNTSSLIPETRTLATTEEVASYVEENVVKNQATATIIVNPITNLSGRVFSSFEYNLVEDTTYPYYQITKGGNWLTEEESRDYMEYMSGSRFLPTYDYNRPQNSVWIMADGTILKPQFEIGGIRLYIVPSPFATKQYVDDNSSCLYRHHFDIIITPTDLPTIPSGHHISINVNALSTSGEEWETLSELDGGGFIISAFGLIDDSQGVPVDYNHIFELKIFYSSLGNGTLLLNVNDLTDNSVKCVALTTVMGGQAPNDFELEDSVTPL